MRDLKELVAELSLENRLLKTNMIGVVPQNLNSGVVFA